MKRGRKMGLAEVALTRARPLRHRRSRRALGARRAGHASGGGRQSLRAPVGGGRLRRPGDGRPCWRPAGHGPLPGLPCHGGGWSHPRRAGGGTPSGGCLGPLRDFVNGRFADVTVAVIDAGGRRAAAGDPRLHRQVHPCEPGVRRPGPARTGAPNTTRRSCTAPSSTSGIAPASTTTPSIRASATPRLRCPGFSTVIS